MSTSSNGSNDGNPVNESALALVSASRASSPPPGPPPGELSTTEAAQALARSPAWIKRHAQELGGRLVEGAYRFPSVAVERRRTTVERITVGGGAPRASEPDVGRRAAAVYQRLEEGQSTSQIVRELEEPPEFVSRTRDQWLAGYEADWRGVTYACSCGAPSHPSTARCLRCHTRARVLSDAQIALLGGQPLPEPGTCTCRGCKATVSVQNVDALCARCAPKLTVDERNGVLVIVLAGTPVRALSIDETRALVQRLAHHIAPTAQAAQQVQEPQR